MFRAKTVLVLGAGASVDLGLPMGDKLLSQIRDLLSFHFEYGTRLTRGDGFIVEALQHHFKEDLQYERLNQHLKAGHRIVNSSLQAPSIDNLVDALEDPAVAFIAKMAIVRAIHLAEKDSLCAHMLADHHRSLDLSGFRGHWYSSLSKLLFENVRRGNVSEIFDNLEVISFNYDRCLETYLPHSISKYYDTSLEEAEALVRGLQIHRPYGIAGKLRTVAFGGGSHQQLADVAQNIRTFTEQVTDNKALDGIRGALEAADRIVFLGFAFHRQNLRLLECQTQPGAEVLATAVGISRSDQAVIQREVTDIFNVMHPPARRPDEFVKLATMKCDEFFGEYWRTLTAESPVHIAS